MKTVKLINLAIKNFKGQNAVYTMANGGSFEISGQNGSGKSTFLDAISWCLYNKNSLGATKFEILPINENVTNASVELTLVVNNITQTFSREVFLNKKGAPVQQLTINEVPYTKGDFDDYVRVEFGEYFYYLVDIQAFFRASVKSRRELLMAMFLDETKAMKEQFDKKAKFDKKIKSLEEEKLHTEIKVKLLNEMVDELPKTKGNQEALQNKINVTNNELDIICQQMLQYEKEVNEVSEFIDDMANEIETTLNANFDYINFKLFQKTQDGDFKDVCDIMYDGKPFDALSNGESIRCSLEFNKFLTEILDTTSFVVVDNAEAVSSPLMIEKQNIQLKVSKHKKITVKEV